MVLEISGHVLGSVHPEPMVRQNILAVRASGRDCLPHSRQTRQTEAQQIQPPRTHPSDLRLPAGLPKFPEPPKIALKAGYQTFQPEPVRCIFYIQTTKFSF
jgi:hypothetical protein